MSTYTLKFNRTNSETVIIDLVNKPEEGEEKIIKTVDLPLSEIPETLENGEHLPMSVAAYGLLKAVQDRNSSLSNKALSEMGLTGEAAMEARIDAYLTTFELFKSGQWKAPTAGGNRGATVDPIFAAAVAELKGCEIGQATAALKAADKEARAAIRSLPQVVEIMKRMKEEAAGDTAGGIDLSDLL